MDCRGPRIQTRKTSGEVSIVWMKDSDLNKNVCRGKEERVGSDTHFADAKGLIINWI